MFAQKPRSTVGAPPCAPIEGLESRTLLSASSVTSITAVVDARSGPWMPGPAYGIGDELAPTVISASSGLPFQVNDALAIQYVSGQVSAGLPQWPLVDAAGDLAYGPVNNSVALSGTHYPSYWISPSEYPTYLVELVGVFTDGAGNFVGSPFAVGDSRTVHIPAGATQLQLGVNDHVFHDNAGGWQLTIREDNGSDLSGTFATPPAASIVHGQGGSTTLAVTNSGPEEARGTVTTSLFLETQPALGNGDVALAAPVTQSIDLTTGASANVSVDFTIPTSTAAGTYYLVGRIAEDGGITDLNLSDKTFSIPVRVSPLLSATMGEGLPVVATPGSRFTVPLTLTSGASQPLIGLANISYWLSKGASVDPSTDVLLATTTHSFSLAANGDTASPGDQVTIPTKVFPGTDRWGEYHVIAVVTPDAGLAGGDVAPPPAPGLTQVFSRPTAPAAAALWEAAIGTPASSFTGSAADLITLDQQGKTYVYFDAAGHPMIGVNLNLNQYTKRTIDAAAGAGTATELRARIQMIQTTWKSTHPRERLTEKAKDYAAFVGQNPNLFAPVITSDQAAALFSGLALKYTRIAAGIIGARKFAALPANVQAVAADVAFSHPATLRAMAAALVKGDYVTAAWDMMNARLNARRTWADANFTQVLGDDTGAPGDFHVLIQSFENATVSFVQPPAST